MNNFWDERFDTDELIYGSEPNNFLKSFIDINFPSDILLPGEGEGRNAIYAASKGWKVTAHDGSEVAKNKALKLAAQKGVSFDYLVSDILDLKTSHLFDAIGLIFLHLPISTRKEAHKQLIKLLKPGGTIFLEMFSKKQIKNDTGGPRNIEMLYSLDDLKEDFKELNIVSAIETQAVLNEGAHHHGEADVIRLIATK